MLCFVLHLSDPLISRTVLGSFERKELIFGLGVLYGFLFALGRFYLEFPF